jgi:hypothetical protein
MSKYDELNRYWQMESEKRVSVESAKLVRIQNHIKDLKHYISIGNITDALIIIEKIECV